MLMLVFLLTSFQAVDRRVINDVIVFVTSHDNAPEEKGRSFVADWSNVRMRVERRCAKPFGAKAVVVIGGKFNMRGRLNAIRLVRWKALYARRWFRRR